MPKPLPPCKNCENRCYACHSNCKGYKDYKIELDKYNDVVKQEHYNYGLGRMLYKKRKER